MSDAAKISARTVLTDPVHLLAFGFGLGLSPIAPGTVGSLLGVALAWLTLDLDLILQVGIAAALFVAGIWICGNSSRRLGQHDPGGIVWDEIGAMYATLLVAPASIDTSCRSVGSSRSAICRRSMRWFFGLLQSPSRLRSRKAISTVRPFVCANCASRM